MIVKTEKHTCSDLVILYFKYFAKNQKKKRMRTERLMRVAVAKKYRKDEKRVKFTNLSTKMINR